MKLALRGVVDDMTVRIEGPRLVALPSGIIILRGAPTLMPHLQFRAGRWFISGRMTTKLLNWIQEREQA